MHVSRLAFSNVLGIFLSKCAPIRRQLSFFPSLFISSHANFSRRIGSKGGGGFHSGRVLLAPIDENNLSSKLTINVVLNFPILSWIIDNLAILENFPRTLETFPRQLVKSTQKSLQRSKYFRIIHTLCVRWKKQQLSSYQARLYDKWLFSSSLKCSSFLRSSTNFPAKVGGTFQILQQAMLASGNQVFIAFSSSWNIASTFQFQAKVHFLKFMERLEFYCLTMEFTLMVKRSRGNFCLEARHLEKVLCYSIWKSFL